MRAGVVLFVLVLLATACGVGAAQDDARQLALEAGQRIRQLQKEADAVAAQSSTILNELRRLELQRQIRAEEVRQADAELAQVLGAIEQGSARLSALEAERQHESPWVRARLVELYKGGRIGYLRLLLAADDLRAMVRMSRGIAAVAELDRVRMAAHRETLRQHRIAMTELEAQRTSAQAARVAAQKARVALDQAVAANNRRLDELDRQRDLAAQYIGELQAAQSQLQRSVSALPGSAKVLPLAPFRGMLEWPVGGRILSRFGRSTADRFGSTVSRNGIEIAVEEGTPVGAVHAGTVVYAAPFSGFGTLVILDHGQNAFTLYGHLSQTAVTPGARVGRTDTVGRAGRTPDGVPALYFELRIDGRPVDPVQWLRSQR
jgi:murein hydrolase activator